MKPYRIKHIKSGFYYQPAKGGYHKSNLSTKGKVYLTNINPLCSKGVDYIWIEVNKSTKIYKKLVEQGIFTSTDETDRYGNISYKVPKDQFIIEELNIT